MDKRLIIKDEDINLIVELSSVSGNVDIDKIRPSVLIAQWSDVQRVLTEPLYNKILNDVESDSLSDEYLKIYDEYVTKLTTFYSISQFISQNSITVNNGGNFQHNPQNGVVVSSKENDRLVKKYRELGAAEEIRFEKFMKTVSVPEYKPSCASVKNNYKFPWQI